MVVLSSPCSLQVQQWVLSTHSCFGISTTSVVLNCSSVSYLVYSVYQKSSRTWFPGTLSLTSVVTISSTSVSLPTSSVCSHILLSLIPCSQYRWKYFKEFLQHPYGRQPSVTLD